MPAKRIMQNRIASYLNKEPALFTKKDLMRYIRENGVRMLNFRYVAGDNRLKTLNFVINDEKYLDRVLSAGERVDGSSLFKNIDASSSDLYVLPRYRTAFVNPFSEVPAVDVLCSFYNPDGTPFASAPENVLKRARGEFNKKTGFDFHALGELEYYVISPKDPLYPTGAQKGYHEAFPFSKWESLRCEAMNAIAEAGGRIKYGHAEVGFIRTEDAEMTQQEIEFLPVDCSSAADQLAVAKWIVSGIGRKYGVAVTFAPKISIGHAGSGLHFHTCLLKNGKNAMLSGSGLSPEAKKAIAGYLKLARSLTAFGNTVPTSYFRLVPHQEAPISVCWGYRNRSALVRVPLGWQKAAGMIKDANPGSAREINAVESSQTVEFRSADGSANLHLFLAGLCCAARLGFEMKDSIKYADDHFVEGNIFHAENKNLHERFPKLPASCRESAQELEKDRQTYEALGVFPPAVIDGVIKGLKGYDDRNLSERLYGKEEEIKKLVAEYLYC
ncbi:MAG: glutamine synthetase family protein [Elusimicrobia bacterium]|nr:glutamine synthetase family protein [Elusimicrobiota bacterium]